MSLQIHFIILLTRSLELVLETIAFVSGLDDLLLEEDLVSIVFVNLESFGFDGFLVHFTHVAQKQCLLPYLTQFILQSFHFLQLYLKIALIITLSLELVYLLLYEFDMLSVSYNKLIVFFLESSFETEVHILYSFVE